MRAYYQGYMSKEAVDTMQTPDLAGSAPPAYTIDEGYKPREGPHGQEAFDKYRKGAVAAAGRHGLSGLNFGSKGVTYTRDGKNYTRSAQEFKNMYRGTPQAPQTPQTPQAPPAPTRMPTEDQVARNLKMTNETLKAREGMSLPEGVTPEQAAQEPWKYYDSRAEGLPGRPVQQSAPVKKEQEEAAIGMQERIQAQQAAGIDPDSKVSTRNIVPESPHALRSMERNPKRQPSRLNTGTGRPVPNSIEVRRMSDLASQASLTSQEIDDKIAREGKERLAPHLARATQEADTQQEILRDHLKRRQTSLAQENKGIYPFRYVNPGDPASGRLPGMPDPTEIPKYHQEDERYLANRIAFHRSEMQRLGWGEWSLQDSDKRYDQQLGRMSADDRAKTTDRTNAAKLELAQTKHRYKMALTPEESQLLEMQLLPQ